MGPESLIPECLTWDGSQSLGANQHLLECELGQATSNFFEFSLLICILQ